eukprot:SAG11_NODE_892_length_6673_cov_7.963797_5_plen_234_part_00
MAFLEEKIASLGTAACPPYHLAIVIGGLSAELCLTTVKYASAKYLDELPTSGNEHGRAFRDLEVEVAVKKMTEDMGIGAQFGGKYFCHVRPPARPPAQARPARPSPLPAVSGWSPPSQTAIWPPRWRHKPSRAEPSRAEPSRAEPSRAEPSRTAPRHCSAQDVRVVRLPRHGASCPVGIGVSCSADRCAHPAPLGGPCVGHPWALPPTCFGPLWALPPAPGPPLPPRPAPPRL